MKIEFTSAELKLVKAALFNYLPEFERSKATIKNVILDLSIDKANKFIATIEKEKVDFMKLLSRLDSIAEKTFKEYIENYEKV